MIGSNIFFTLKRKKKKTTSKPLMQIGSDTYVYMYQWMGEYSNPRLSAVFFLLLVGSLIFVRFNAHKTTVGQFKIRFQRNFCVLFVCLSVCVKKNLLHIFFECTHIYIFFLCFRYSFYSLFHSKLYFSGDGMNKKKITKQQNEKKRHRVCVFNLKHRLRLLDLSYNQNKRNAFSHVAEDLTHNHIVAPRITKMCIYTGHNGRLHCASPLWF